MRLSHIKLAGFKSFVDPTHIPVPGSLVGVVGPNGCGKSNVIDAVRWVLGESSARHLRGETMQDVIFNGAGDRTPSSRASVELVFDNALGKAGGPWTRYSEISVKRVLERDGESTYLINNQHVRRRDVADIFLGTGLGGRAYAIIEQGMISRIVEARPEELRIFLEEAAGVSKYRERRKETEQRLADTRDNLLRVDDILEELGRQLAHLEVQAEAATRYRELQSSLRTTQQLLWFLRKQEAGNQRARLQRDLDQLTLEIEAETARLREQEALVEHSRTSHYSASDRLHADQGALYEASAEVARIEQDLGHLRETRRRLEAQLAGERQQREQHQAQIAALGASRGEAEKALAAARELALACQEAAQAAAARLPEAEAAHAGAQEALDALQRKLALNEQQAQVERTRAEHADKLLQQFAARRDRLEQETQDLSRPDPQALERMRAELAEVDLRYRDKRELLAAREQDLPSLDDAYKAATASAEAASQELKSLEARHEALQVLQDQVTRSAEMRGWLDARQLQVATRLWQGLRIRAGWEDALEAVLRERLNAIGLDALDRVGEWLGDAPPGKVSFFERGAAAATPAADDGLTPLTDYIACSETGVAAVLADWLHGVYLVPEGTRGLEMRSRLPAGGMLVSREGHVFTRTSVSLHAADSEVHGILARQREIEELAASRAELERALAVARNRLSDAAAQLDRIRQEMDGLRHEVEDIQHRRHELQLEHLRQTQLAERAVHRQGQIEQELAEIAAEAARETEQAAAAQATLARTGQQAEALRQQLEAARQALAVASEALANQRAAAQQSQREAQEASFSQKINDNKINEISSSLQNLHEQEIAASSRLAEIESDIAGLDESEAAQRLEAGLTRRVACEQAVAAAREAVSQAETALREAEQGRLASEQKLGPLRERVGDLRLKEQEVRLAEENFAQQLDASGADQAQLASLVEKGTRPSGLQAEINRLNEEIAALGAVNLAALEELQAARERKAYLDSQSHDLKQAVDTLESAIRRMDRETRERMQSTFDAVNRHFGTMFPALFGGGEARLVMLGEEILDAGVQVIARPPGKRNTSIHLLSGGEKALTALALVFSLFQLNPAPFCLLDEVDAPLDDSNTERFCDLVRKMSQNTQFLFISHNKITMEMASQLIGITMPEQGISRVVAVDIEEALRIREEAAA